MTLPKLAALVVAPLATKTKDWFEGSAGEVEVEQLRGLGTEWRALTPTVTPTPNPTPTRALTPTPTQTQTQTQT